MTRPDENQLIPEQESRGLTNIAGVLPWSMKTEKRECSVHGEYDAGVMLVAGRERASMCPACKDAATAQELSDREAERQRDIADGRRRMIESRIATAGIPVRFRECTFDGFVVKPGPLEDKQKTALRVCRAFAERWDNVQRKGSVLVMNGSTGTGKTHLACAIANSVMHQHNAAVAFGTVSEHVRSVKSAFQKDSERSEQSAIQALVEPDLLIMDELGQRMTEYDQQLIFDVMNARYSAMRPMVLMTNLTLDELNQILGDRLADRLREVGAFVSLAWPSYRGSR